MTEDLPLLRGKSFEELKQINQYGAEYWYARDLQLLFGYRQWRSFENAIDKAEISCEQSGNQPENHFVRARKMVELGSNSTREIADYQLSRFACYLIAQNGDPRKPEIANAQKYFAIQTRRQELSDQHAADVERLEMRHQVKEEFKTLSGAARKAGVQTRMFGAFHDAGYKGLYGGMGAGDIKAHKGISRKENLMDRMDATELAANQFRMTQTREKLAKQGTKRQEGAIQTHNEVGKEVRAAIKRIGGKLPEDILPADPIKIVEKRLRNIAPRLELEGKNKKGLEGIKEESRE